MTTAEIQNEIRRRALEAGYSCNLHKSMGGSEYQQIACEFDCGTASEAGIPEGWNTYTVRYADHASHSNLHSRSRADWEFLTEQQELWESILDSVEFRPACVSGLL